jgi:hypothetical protein
MNNTLKNFADYLTQNNLKYSTDDDNEDVIWFIAKLPNNEAVPLFYLNYNEENGSLVIMASRIVKFGSVNLELMKAVNAFNSDPSTFNCKAFIDNTGEFVVNNSSFVRNDENANDMILSLVDITVASLSKHYDDIVNTIEESMNESPEK